MVEGKSGAAEFEGTLDLSDPYRLVSIVEHVPVNPESIALQLARYPVLVCTLLLARQAALKNTLD